MCKRVTARSIKGTHPGRWRCKILVHERVANKEKSRKAPPGVDAKLLQVSMGSTEKVGPHRGSRALALWP